MTKRVLITLLVMCPGLSNGQTDILEPMDGPFSANVFSIVARPEGSLLVGTGDGIYFSTNQGRRWERLPSSPPGSINDLIDAGTGILYAASNTAFQHDVFLSTDDGTTWRATGLNKDYVQVLAKSASGVLFAGAQNGGLFRLESHESQWTLTLPSSLIYRVVTYGDTIFAASVEGLFRSNDNGQTWSQLPDSASVTSALGIHLNGNVITSSYKGTFYSEDNGNSWSKISNLSAEAFGSDSFGNIFLASFEGIFLSTNSGVTWSPTDTTTPQITAYGITCDDQNNVYVGFYREGIFFSSNQGQRWEHRNNGLRNLFISSVLAPTDSTILASSISGVFQSTDRGNSWAQLLPAQSIGYVETLAMNSRGFLFAGSWGSDIQLSSDGGQTWRTILSPHYYISSIACAPDGTVYAATLTGAIVSHDNGAEWVKLGFDSIWLTSVIVAPNGSVYFGSNENGIFLVHPNGSISQVSSHFGFINCLAYNSDGTLFAGTDGDGCFRSTDGGNTWTNIDNNSPAKYIYSIAIDNGGHIYASTFYYGVVTSSDNGNSWQQMMSEPDGVVYSSLAVSPNGYLYAGSDAGLYRTISPVTIPGGPPPSLLLPHISQNYPNPFNSGSTVSFFLPRSQVVTIEIYDLLGRKVMLLADGFFSQGWHSMLINSGSLTSGTYFLNLRTTDYSQTRKLQILK